MCVCVAMCTCVYEVCVCSGQCTSCVCEVSESQITQTVRQETVFSPLARGTGHAGAHSDVLQGTSEAPPDHCFLKLCSHQASSKDTLFYDRPSHGRPNPKPWAVMGVCVCVGGGGGFRPVQQLSVNDKVFFPTTAVYVISTAMTNTFSYHATYTRRPCFV